MVNGDSEEEINCNRLNIEDVESEPLNLNDNEWINADAYTDIECKVSRE